MTKREIAATLASFGYQRLLTGEWVKPVGYTLFVIDVQKQVFKQVFFQKTPPKTLAVWNSRIVETTSQKVMAEDIRSAEHYMTKLTSGTVPPAPEPPDTAKDYMLNPSNSEYVFWAMLNQSD